jgi:hypothetical protein
MRIFIERSVAQGNDGCAHAIRSGECLALNQSIVVLSVVAKSKIGLLQTGSEDANRSAGATTFVTFKEWASRVAAFSSFCPSCLDAHIGQAQLSK